MNKYKLFLLAVLAAALQACGGSGTDSPITQTAPQQFVGTAPEGAPTPHRASSRQLAMVEVNSIEDSIEAKIYRLYQAAFDRKPDLGGLGFWIYYMKGGKALEDVSWGFTNSEEFKNLYGANATHEEFVTRLYRNVLHRLPDPGGYQSWLHVLYSGSLNREQVLIGFSESLENRRNVYDQIKDGINYIPHGWEKFTVQNTLSVPYDGAGSPAIATGDFNGDGLMDLSLFWSNESAYSPTANTTAQSVPVKVFTQTPDGAMADATNTLFTRPMSMILVNKLVATDINGDGKDDIIAASAGPDPYENGQVIDAGPNGGAGDVARWAISSDTGFQTYTAAGMTPRFLHNICKGDINSDGKEDSLIVSITDKSYMLMHDGKNNVYLTTANLPAEVVDPLLQKKIISRHPDGQVKESTYPQFSACALVDANGDGKLDLLMLGFSMPYHALYLNDGKGSFANSQRIEISAEMGYGTGYRTDNHVNNGSGATAYYSEGTLSLNAVVMDVNGDGKDDVVVLTSRDQRGPKEYIYYRGAKVQVLINTGKNFVDESSRIKDFVHAPDVNYTHYDNIMVADVNGDGTKDIILARGTRSQVIDDPAPNTRFLINDGAGNFYDRTQSIELPRGTYVPMNIGGRISLVRTRAVYAGNDPITRFNKYNMEVQVFTNGIAAKR